MVKKMKMAALIAAAAVTALLLAGCPEPAPEEPVVEEPAAAVLGTAVGVTENGLTAYLGGEACQMTLTSMKKDTAEQLTGNVIIGDKSAEGVYTLGWNAYDKFYGVTNLADEFVLEYTFTEETLGANNWNHWAFVLKNGDDLWYLRADNFSVETLDAFPRVTHENTYNWTDFKSNFNGKALVLTVTKTAESIVAQLKADGTAVYTATALPPLPTMTTSLGGENCYVNVTSIKINNVETLTEAASFGTDDGTYAFAFDTDVIQANGLSIADDWTVAYTFTEKTLGAQNFHNWVVSVINNADSSTMVIRADNWGWGRVSGFADLGEGTNSLMTSTYNWDSFASTFHNKVTVLTITKTDASIVITAAVDGAAPIYTVTVPAESASQ